MRRLLLLVSFSLLLGSAVVRADTLTRLDGKVLAGDIIADDVEAVTIRTDVGEVRVPRSELREVRYGEPPFDTEGALEEQKKKTAGELELLAKQAEEAKQADKARQLRELAEEVRRWALKAVPPKDAPKPFRSGLDFEELRDRLASIRRDQSLTELQREAAVEKHMKSAVGKTARFTGTVLEASREPDAIRLLVEGRHEKLWFNFALGSAEAKKLAAVKKGSVVAIDAQLTWEAPAGKNEPTFLMHVKTLKVTSVGSS